MRIRPPTLRTYLRATESTASSVFRLSGHTWAFSIILSDDKNVYQIVNQGIFTRFGDQGEGLTFESTNGGWEGLPGPGH